MEQGKLQWHPAFSAALRIELEEFSENTILSNIKRRMII